MGTTGTAPGALSLMAFTLRALWERDQERGQLTLEAYHAIGGVAGAIRRRAEEALKPLERAQSRELQPVLDAVFGELVEVNEQGVATRRRASLERIRRDNQAERLIDALIDARLLVVSEGEAKEPSVEVAHEALLSEWPRLRQWIERHAAELWAQRDLDRAAREWKKAGKPRWSGLPVGEIRKRYRRAPSPSALAGEYLRACQRQAWVRRGLASVAASLAAAIVIAAVWLYANGLTLNHGTAMLRSAVGLYSVAEPEMVPIPPGEFWMGSKDDDPEAFSDENPYHKVVIKKSFSLGKYEVTFEEYDQFAYATGRQLPSDQGWGRGRRPVINVSWKDATAYAEWLSRKTGKRYRLPTEAEWEYAARAGTQWRRFWGDNPDQACQYANVADQSFRQQYGGKIHNCDDKYVITAEVGSFKFNGLGLYDMLGNVWEWVQDCWNDGYESAPTDDSAWLTGDCHRRVLRGGSWGSEPVRVRSASRFWSHPDLRTNFVGFRLAEDL